LQSSFTAMIVSCRKYISVAYSSLQGYTSHLLQSLVVFNINITAIAKQYRPIIHESKQSYYSLLFRQCVGHAEYNILDEHNVSVSKAERLDLLSAECCYTPSRQHAITTQKIKMLCILRREHWITNQRT